jgi:hypothetical protein
LLVTLVFTRQPVPGALLPPPGVVVLRLYAWCGTSIAPIRPVIAAINSIVLLPWRRHRSQQLFSKGVLSAAARAFGGVPKACDPIRSSPQIDGGRINRLSHWTLPT